MSTATTNDPPPAYNEADVKNVEHAVLESFLTPDVQAQFKDQINGFTIQTQMLAERFRTVKDKLEEIDTHKFDEPLAPTWIGLRDRYLQHIDASETIAADIATAAHKYLTFVVKPAAAYHQKGEISAQDLEDLNVEIQDLLTDAKELKTKFATLIADVKSFRDKIVSEKFGAARFSENQQKMTEFDVKISQLQVELNDINADLERAQNALKYGGIATGVLVTFTAWCPVVALTIFAAGALTAIGSGTAIAVYSHRAASKLAFKLRNSSPKSLPKDKSKEISDAKAEKKKLQDENDLITSIRVTLKSLGEHELNDVVNGLEFFRAIWAAIGVDCQSIGQYMTDLQARKKTMDDVSKSPSAYFSLKQKHHRPQTLRKIA
ncbi:hypothetical protein FRC20_001985 [Serendipita sp. 405]|nr:hypothetical protein FRC15_002029 [Serendipita sp. 397]KAG8786170.1 hypothetical protein FRC16_001794 [Serendipita sp. 398]KAG8850564.1 hypothetical protein FRC20_001985 [Serendipita sp. 405]